MVGPFTFAGSGPDGTHRMLISSRLLAKGIKGRERGGKGGQGIGCHQFIISDDYSGDVMTPFLSVPDFCIEKFLMKLCLPIRIID